MRFLFGNLSFFCILVDCQWAEFDDRDWTECSERCGEGQKSRTREKIQEVVGEGIPCNPADGEETMNCKIKDCPGIYKVNYIVEYLIVCRLLLNIDNP